MNPPELPGVHLEYVEQGKVYDKTLGWNFNNRVLDFIYNWYMDRSKPDIIHGCDSTLDRIFWRKDRFWLKEEASA